MGGKTAEGEFRGESKRLAGKVLHKSSGVLRKEMFRIVRLIFKFLTFFWGVKEKEGKFNLLPSSPKIFCRKNMSGKK